MSAMDATLDFSSERFLLFIIYKSSRCYLLSFKSICLSVLEKNRKVDFQDGHHGGHLGFLRNNLAIFDLPVTPMLPIQFRVKCPFGSGEEAKNRFSRWPPWRPSRISYRNDFSYFRFISHPDAFYQVLSQLAIRFRRKSEKQILRWPPWRPS